MARRTATATALGAAIALLAPIAAAASPFCCGASPVLHDLPCCQKAAGDFVEPEFADCCHDAVDVPDDPRAEASPAPAVGPAAAAVPVATPALLAQAPRDGALAPPVERPPDRAPPTSTTVLLL